MKMIFVRHCETDWNAIGRIQGQTNTHLNEKGRSEARTLAKLLSGFKIDRIITSSLTRATETASIIGNTLNIDMIQSDSRLVECSHGILDGLTRTELIEKYGEDFFKSFSDRSEYDFKKFGGESRADILTREHSLLHEIKEKYSDETILLVGHGRALNTLLDDLHINTILKRGDFIVVD